MNGIASVVMIPVAFYVPLLEEPLLWSAFGPTLAFGYSVLLFIAGAVLVARIR